MNKIFKHTIIFLCFSIAESNATDLFVYPYATSPHFDNIQSAIDSANDNDRIFIDTFTYVGNLNVNKSLSFFPMQKGGKFTVNGSINLEIINNRIISFNSMIASGMSSNFTGAHNDSSSVVINSCEFSSNVYLNNDYSIRSYLYYSIFDGNVYLDEAELIGNIFKNYVELVPNQGRHKIVPPKIKIFANKFKNRLKINWADQSNIHIANNFFFFLTSNNKTIECYNSSNSSHKGETIIIENNIIKSTYSTYSHNNYNISIKVNNCKFLFIRNNYFDLNTNSHSTLNRGIELGGIDVYDFQFNFSNWNGNFLEGSGSVQTIANNTYNTVLSYDTINQLSYGIVNSNNGIDSGSNLPECRDINNTINDIGTYGGPHSWVNYHNNSNSHAQIIDLEIPYIKFINQGTNFNIKSKAIHRSR